MLTAADAALVIGDPALYFEGDASRLDLGEEWTGAHRTALRVRLLGGAARGGVAGRRARGCRPPWPPAWARSASIASSYNGQARSAPR